MVAASAFLVLMQTAPGHAQSGAECNQQMESSGIGPRLDRLRASAGDDTVLLLRGTIATLDQMIAMSQPCMGDPAVQQAVSGWQQTRDSSLTTCRQIASYDNCEVSPW
jgi:hypothetical protein